MPKSSFIKKIFPFLICFIWVVLLINIFTSALPIHTNRSFINKIITSNAFPQGWGFFTRDPRQEKAILYTIKNGNVEKFTETNNLSKFYFGLSRKNRLISIEASIITSSLRDVDSLWVDSEGGSSFILDQSIKTDTVVNKFKPCNIRGDFFIVKQERTPWAWSTSYDDIVMPYKYRKIHVK